MVYTRESLFKVLGADGMPCHGGTGRWSLPRGGRPGKWMPKVAHPVPCVRGYHVVSGLHLPRRVGECLFEVEVRGSQVADAEKSAVESRRGSSRRSSRGRPR